MSVCIEEDDTNLGELRQSLSTKRVPVEGTKGTAQATIITEGARVINFDR